MIAQRQDSTSEVTLNERLKRALQEEMDRSHAVIAKGAEVMPRFRVIAPEGDYSVLVRMSDDDQDRQARLKLVAGFIAWKMASAFIVAGENQEPDGIFSFAVSAEGAKGQFRQIERDSAGNVVSLGETRILDHQQCDPQFLSMLPETEAAIDPVVMSAMKQIFGLDDEWKSRRLQ